MKKAPRLVLPVLVTVSACLASAVGPPALWGRSGDEPSLEQRAAEAYAASDWPEAYRLYSELSRATPDDGATWLRLGQATLEVGESPTEAIAAYERALELEAPRGPALYGLARAHALGADRAGVLATLERLLELGPSRGVVARIEAEPAFDFVRSDSQFADAVKRLTPCTAEEYRQFDFWIGGWEVYSPQDQLLGTNTVTEELDGCMLTERWESVRGGKGFSINYYDAATEIWTQTYRDNTGNIAQWPDLQGGLRDGAMVLETSNDPDNRTRWTWTKISGDEVRQMAESSTDGGETWRVVWDSYYRRQGE